MVSEVGAEDVGAFEGIGPECRSRTIRAVDRRWIVAGALILILAGAAFARFADLSTNPGGMYPDEAAEALSARQITRDSGGAQLFVSVYDESLGSSVAEAASNYVSSSVQPYIAELQTSEVSEQGSVGGNVVANGSFEYQGLIASQGGNAPVEGFVAIFVRSDGSVVVYEELNEQGSYDTFKDDFGAMFGTLVPTL